MSKSTIWILLAPATLSGVTLWLAKSMGLVFIYPDFVVFFSIYLLGVLVFALSEWRINA